MLVKKFSRQQIDDIFHIFSRKYLWYFMQIVSRGGDNLHKMSKSIFFDKYFEMSSAENFTQHA